jgi:DNA-binding CsgD family transcriptional regulator
VAGRLVCGVCILDLYTPGIGREVHGERESRRLCGRMSELEYQRLRRLILREGVVADAWWGELRAMTRLLVRTHTLPPVYAPYGTWDTDAEQEVFQAWVTERLIGAGQLRALVAVASDRSHFRALAEISLRQHLINRRKRSASQNLYGRLRRLLEQDEAFRCFVDSRKSAERWWGLADWQSPTPFSADDRRLLAAAWAAGELALVRYRQDARKLSPVVDADELRRFALTVLGALDALLTPGLLLRALQLRVELDEPRNDDLESVPQIADEQRPALERIVLHETALLAIAELTARQAEVLLGTAEGKTLAAMADRLGCSRATVLNEQQRAGVVLSDLSTDNDERALLLNTVLEVLYEARE